MKCLTPTTRSKIVTPNARSKGKIWVAVSNIFERVVGVKILHPRFFFYTNEHQTFEHVDSNYTFEKKFEHFTGRHSDVIVFKLQGWATAPIALLTGAYDVRAGEITQKYGTLFWK